MFKIYVGNLDYKVKLEQLRELFAVYAPIEDLVIPTDPKTNRAKGFAIVMIRDAELGEAAVKAMQGKRLMGRTLVVNQAVKKKKGETAPAKTDVLRSGPFGPRMNRFGDPRVAGGSRPNRNPRRMGGAARPGGGPSESGARPTNAAPGATPGATPGPAPAGPASVRGAAPALPPRPQVPARDAAPASGAPKPAPTAPAMSKPPARPETPMTRTPAAAPPAVRGGSAAQPPSAPPSGGDAATAPRPKAQRLASPKRPQSGDAESGSK